MSETTTNSIRALHDCDPDRNTILYVDDEPLMRSMLKRMLTRLVTPGLKADSAENYDDAIAKITNELSERIVLIITDVEMYPGLTGLDLANALRGANVVADIRDRLRRVPIIICSGNHAYGDLSTEEGRVLQDMIGRGEADAFMPKPFADPSTLSKVIERAAARVLERTSE